MIFRIISFILLYLIFYGCTGENIDYPLHKNITATVFWIGEEGDEDNGYIPNVTSAWDDNWINHYGGYDDPNNRNGFYPAEFIPNENPFYCALPYNDFDEDGNRKKESYEIVYWANEKEWLDNESMLKNRWIKIIKSGKECYAQWEDVGPFGENDYEYVFGMSMPQNTINYNAGIDLSPAVRDYFGLSDIDTISWQFVNYEDVPEGPWKDIITTSQIDWE